MKDKEVYVALFEKYNLSKSEAITFLNHRIGVAIDKTKMIETLSANIDKLTILCGDLKLELRLHESNPLFAINHQQFYTTAQAASILNISAQKIRDLIKSGKLTKKVISQRDWKIPSWSLEAYKNDLCNFLTTYPEPIESYDILEIVDSENQPLEILISNLGIHSIFENETRLKRKVTDLITKI